MHILINLVYLVLHYNLKLVNAVPEPIILPVYETSTNSDIVGASLAAPLLRQPNFVSFLQRNKPCIKSVLVGVLQSLCAAAHTQRDLSASRKLPIRGISIRGWLLILSLEPVVLSSAVKNCKLPLSPPIVVDIILQLFNELKAGIPNSIPDT